MSINNIDISAKVTRKENKNELPIINNNNIKQVLLFSLILITILLQTVVKIWTFILLINYYDTLNNITSDKNVIYDDYKYIYYLAITNLVFTIVTISYFLIVFYIYIYKYPIYNKYKKKVELSITIMWVLSSILSMISYIIRNKIKYKYIKYLNDSCNIYEKLLYNIIYISFAFFCLSFIIEYYDF